MKNHQKKKVLIFTDSRGFEITKMTNRKNPLSSYIRYYIENYNTTVRLCRYKHTTILDFIAEYRGKYDEYDLIILHCGVVDFSPRPMSNGQYVHSSKKEKCIKLFGEEPKFDTYSTEYEGELTRSLYNKDFLDDYILSELKSIPNLLWISSNPVIEGWDGNYKRKRPKNMNIIQKLDNHLISNLPLVISLWDWTNEDVKRYTVDNIHFNKMGFDKLLVEMKRVSEIVLRSEN
ncbi:hypothetical protein VV869_24125 [Photobacterium sp. MCCC 1A19761]|uniref:hypothetical protein n=1 Tax=Photobacterium sp. MCCC 1A19761 TaxID=3115000 RepID=UPI00307F440E